MRSRWAGKTSTSRARREGLTPCRLIRSASSPSSPTCSTRSSGSAATARSPRRARHADEAVAARAVRSRRSATCSKRARASSRPSAPRCSPISTPRLRWRWRRRARPRRGQDRQEPARDREDAGHRGHRSLGLDGRSRLTLVERAPYGVIGVITPVTNPSDTIINNGISMIAAATRCSVRTERAASRRSRSTR